MTEVTVQQGFEADVTHSEFHDVLRAAFDYRGNVTLFLNQGAPVEGYIFNMTAGAVEVWPKDDSPRQRIPIAHITRIAFSGRDTAEGKSWEAWMKQYNAKKTQVPQA